MEDSAHNEIALYRNFKVVVGQNVAQELSSTGAPCEIGYSPQKSEVDVVLIIVVFHPGVDEIEVVSKA